MSNLTHMTSARQSQFFPMWTYVAALPRASIAVLQRGTAKGTETLR
jgi:hypothetical protein